MRKCLIRPAVSIQIKRAAATNTTMILLVTLIVLTYLPHAKPDLDRLPRTPVIQTKYGAVQGRILTPEGVAKPVHVFKGIPYATPPVGSNRWEPTRAPGPWDGVMQAISPGPVCPQSLPTFPKNHNTANGSEEEKEALSRMPKPRLRFLQMIRAQLLRQSEDCLYLNIYVPQSVIDRRASEQVLKKQGASKSRGAAVMVYVHGESFKWGTGNLWDAQVLAALGNVIVVTFNYRLGILGFLNANGSPLTRGQVANYGLMDQMAVLQWVQENSIQFGGDPQRVTLVGHGTGAACIEYLTHSPTTVPDLTNEHGKIVDCLRNVSADQLMSTDLNIPSFHVDFGPSFDGVTIKNNFADIKGKRSFGTRTYDALIGIVTHDFFNELSDTQIRFGMSLDERDKMFQTFVRNQYSAHLQEILLTMQNEYTDWQVSVQKPTSIREQVLQAFSDALYASPGIFSAGTFARKSKNTYFYHFAHHSKMGPYGQLHVGSTHGSELPYVFGIPISNAWNTFNHDHFSRQEEMLSKAMIKYWTNFAKTGSPNNDESFNDEKILHWESYDLHQKYLELGSRPRVLHHYRGHKMSIWLSLIPQLQKTGQNSIYPSHNSLILDGPSWGIVRNASRSNMMANIDNKVKDGMAPPSTTCMTITDSAQVLHQHNDTLLRLEAASKTAYSYALGITVGLGGILCFLNGMLLLCLCQKRSARKRNASQCGDPNTSIASAADYLTTSSQPQTPQVHFHNSSLSRTVPRGQRTVMMTSGGLGNSGVAGGQSNQYRTFHTSRRNSGTYVQVPRPDIDLTTRPASSMSSTATIRVGMNRTAKNRAAAGPNSMTASVEDHFPMEPIPAPPAQFNTNNEDEVNAHSHCDAITTENMALIRNSPQTLVRSNGHAVNCIR